MSNILIVGATGDIGNAVHKLFQNDKVISVSNKRTPKFTSKHYFMNLTKEVNLRDLHEMMQDLTHLDALIYTPGFSHFGMIQDVTITDMDTQYTLSMKNLVLFIQATLPLLKKSKYGRIIVVSSIWGQAGASCESIYASMKGAQNTLVKSLAKELALTNVTVNAVAPGVVSGHMTNELSTTDQEILLDELPQNKFIEPNEVAKLIEFICSESSKSITGEVFNINGGWYT
ncbi:SDR family oxidoreductase [Phocicoccus pinnipedialis]|uniref:Cyclopentanol dehydrogenase n=1 Tax=Phocicoccus pinnipedialis TaxID=110845 RepID=A0A6V7RGH1_9BACL|nr:SDR family oxidoreductase [Jeotgalicoccus pinnipedialis]MBP1939133.1 3-oxoacyl-[acyl-carrier protein] reductase [Jeotgalicoccus pinnipedialis]CAD2076657.1 Cyclopentanol dehydrogenase [Jeotgalicoccus pinnipedialis]